MIDGCDKSFAVITLDLTRLQTKIMMNDRIIPWQGILSLNVATCKIHSMLLHLAVQTTQENANLRQTAILRFVQSHIARQNYFWYLSELGTGGQGHYLKAWPNYYPAI